MSAYMTIVLGISAAAMIGLWRTAGTRRRRSALAALAVVGVAIVGSVQCVIYRGQQRSIDALEVERRAFCIELARQLLEVEGTFANFVAGIDCTSRSGSCALRAFATGIEEVVSEVSSECIAHTGMASCSNQQIWFPGQGVTRTRNSVRAHARALETGQGCKP